MNTTPTQRRSTGTRASDTRARLLAATREVVAERGVAGATSRQITDTAQANLASITYHFGSKDDLVAAALLAEIEQLVEPALAVLETDGEPATRLLETVQLLLRAFADERDRAPLYFEAIGAELRSGGDRASSLMATLRARIAAVLEDLRARSTIPAWVDPDAMSALIVATGQGIVLQSALDPEGPGADQQATQFATLLLNAQT